jgi:hypothetical protein
MLTNHSKLRLELSSLRALQLREPKSLPYVFPPLHIWIKVFLVLFLSLLFPFGDGLLGGVDGNLELLWRFVHGSRCHFPSSLRKRRGAQTKSALVIGSNSLVGDWLTTDIGSCSFETLTSRLDVTSIVTRPANNEKYEIFYLYENKYTYFLAECFISIIFH